MSYYNNNINIFIKEYEETGIEPKPNHLFRFDIDIHGKDMFYMALNRGYDKTIKFLISKGFDPCSKENTDLLKIALNKYDIKMFEKLTLYGLKLNPKYKFHNEILSVEREIKYLLRNDRSGSKKLSSRYLYLEEILKYFLKLRAKNEETLIFKFSNNILNISSDIFTINNELIVDVINLLSTYNISVIKLAILKESIKIIVSPINDIVKDEIEKMLIEELGFLLTKYSK